MELLREIIFVFSIDIDVKIGNTVIHRAENTEPLQGEPTMLSFIDELTAIEDDTDYSSDFRLYIGFYLDGLTYESTANEARQRYNSYANDPENGKEEKAAVVVIRQMIYKHLRGL